MGRVRVRVREPIDGVALDPAKTYRIAALAYTVIGADGYSAFRSYTNPVRKTPTTRRSRRT
ncbi:hypothetical protein ABZX12_28985 [Kribbella sp. NPDC003505]|uniref:hypothetical protein n=1 Tax=Kribbella sp. NPDC003505 TaxID=3154448 RepID=UPI0033A04E9B